MNLLPENQLIWSATVANSRMNRERNASGINSYEQEIGFKPELFIAELVLKSGQAAWADLCCGAGLALSQTEAYLEKAGLQKNVHLEGVDLISNFKQDAAEKSNIHFIFKPVLEWAPACEYDLITCIHGLHYIGDKLKLVELAVKDLKENGLFIANLDLNNISIGNDPKNNLLKKRFHMNGFTYNNRKKILSRKGNQPVNFHMKYSGADDQFGPNYTGQDSVLSYYDT